MNDSENDKNGDLEVLFDSVDELLVMKNGQGEWLVANRVARTAFQLSGTYYRGKTDTELAALVPAIRPFLSLIADADNRAWEAGKPILFERSFDAAEGGVSIWEIALTPQFDTQGRPARLMIVSRNITERRRIEDELRQSEARYRLIADHMSDVIGTTDAAGRITYTSPSVKTMLGYSPRALVGVDLCKVVHAEDHELINTALAKIDFGGKAQRLIECRCLHSEGTYLWVEVGLSAIRAPDGSLKEAIFSAREITDRKKQELLLQRIAFRDPLTNVFNRRALMDRLESASTGADGVPTGFALLYMDVDSFKPINDQWGHDVGDELLVQLTQRTQMELRPWDVLARLGGDEFVVLLKNVNRDKAVKIASRICHALQYPWHLGFGTVEASVSIGVAIYPDAGVTAHGLLRSADTALYQAKAAGRGCVRLYDREL